MGAHHSHPEEAEYKLVVLLTLDVILWVTKASFNKNVIESMFLKNKLLKLILMKNDTGEI